MATVNTPRTGIPYPDENSTPDVPRDLGAAARFIDNMIMPVDVGPLSSEPPSSSAAPGVKGRAMVVTDQTLTGPRLDVDTGTGWFTAGPAPVDAAANIPSSRTLGNGAQQACAGNDPRLVGGAQATGDISGPYPGPITVNTWGGQSKAQVVSSSAPQVHAPTHAPGGTDPVTGLTAASMAPASVDGAATTASVRTLGTGAQQAAPGNDSRFGGVLVTGDLVVSAATTRAGCLLCDGSAVNRLNYSALFAAIGTAYGAGDGSSTFNLPNYVGRVIVGAGSGWALGSAGGEVNHTLATAEMPVHAHGIVAAATGIGIYAATTGVAFNDPGHAHTWWAGNSHSVNVYNGSGASWGAAGTTATGTSSNGTGAWLTDPGHAHSVSDPTHAHGCNNAGSGGAHNNMQPYQTANVFIKT